jgi:hypothetical protein
VNPLLSKIPPSTPLLWEVRPAKARCGLTEDDYKRIFCSLDKHFIEWFVGFTDSTVKVLFLSRLSLRRPPEIGEKVQLMFQIGLHWDDLPLLTYLKDKFQCGYITQNPKEAKANFVISSQAALKGLIIPLFDSFTLNTTKYLDYLAFR